MPTIEAHRQAIDKIGMLIHVKNMQLEVFRRAIESNQGDLNALAEEKTTLLTQANNQLTSNLLPTLPIETITQIFAYLYWMEESVWLSDNTTTLQRLLDDGGTNVDWRNLIHSQIPIQLTVVSTGAKGMAYGNTNLVGPHPRIFLTHQLNDHSEVLLKRSSTSIFATMSPWTKLPEDFDNIRQFPWHNLVLSPCGYESSEEKTEIMKTFVLNFGHKLAELDRLEFHPFYFYNGVALNTSLPVKDFDGRQILMPKIRIARVPSQLLPGLRPILSNITVLDTTTSDHPESLKTNIQVDVFLERLEPYSSNIISLTLTDSNAPPRRRRRSIQLSEDLSPVPDPNPRTRRILFPRLRRLKLVSFSEYVVQDVVSAMDCPILSHLSVSTRDDRRNNSVSTALLHNSFPKLECVAVDLCNVLVRLPAYVCFNLN